MDWYAWGVDVLLPSQHGDGSWEDIHTRPVDTCFALLFLKRLNVAHDLTKVLQSMGGARDPLAKPGEQQTAQNDPLGSHKQVPSVAPGVRAPGEERPALVDLAMRTLATEHFDRFVARVPISRARAGR